MDLGKLRDAIGAYSVERETQLEEGSDPHQQPASMKEARAWEAYTAALDEMIDAMDSAP